jgi:hypothetical protein
MFEHGVICPHCHAEVVQDWSDHVVNSDVVDKNRGMGAETEHSIECDECECPKCGKLFIVKGSVWEYPEGAYNTHELNATVSI